MKNRALHITLAATLLLSSCGRYVPDRAEGVFPDYRDVTIPVNIAPLQYHYTAGGLMGAKTVFECEELRVTKRGRFVEWELEEWRSFVRECAGKSISVSATLRHWKGGKEKISFSIQVSPDSVDSYLTYRLIEPGYEVWHEVELRERCLENWDERCIATYANTSNACMNCHIHSGTRGDLSMFYLRGKGGGAILNSGGSLRKLRLRDSLMVSSTVYGEIHPEGRYGVFSSNIIHPLFHTRPGARLEVYDSRSDLVVADLDKDSILHSPIVERADRLETFPCWSADGRSIIFCKADTASYREVENIRYDLCRIGFDSSTGSFGPVVETLWDASLNEGSACHPKASPDGRWLVFTKADYGTFPIWHRECDLWILDLASGEARALEGANSPYSDSYHSWSSNGRWLLFASKREDGQYGRPYLCHIDDEGNASKAFVLPQKESDFYLRFFKSFNIPDLGSAPVPFGYEDIPNLLH